MLINSGHKLAEVIHHDFRLVPIISRFGIPFGFGDKSIAQICKENSVNQNFFIEVVNAFHDADYKPDKKLRDFSMKMIVEYLLKSHHYYRNVKIPLIEKLIDKLFWTSDTENKNKPLLVRFFNNYKKEVEEHTQNEEEKIYPYVLDLEKAFSAHEHSSFTKLKIENSPVQVYAGEHEELNTSLLDLKNIIIKYLPPADNLQVTEQILIEVFRLEKDMKDHTRMEDKVLIPKVTAMENNILNR